MDYKSKPIMCQYDSVIVSVRTYQGVERLDLRHYYTDRAGELQPSKKGISVKIQDAKTLIADICEVMFIFETEKTKPVLVSKVESYMPIHVKIDEYESILRVDIRHYWLPEGKKKLQASDKGVAIPINMLPTLRAILIEIVTQIGAPAETEQTPIQEAIPVDFSFETSVPDKRFSMIEA